MAEHEHNSEVPELNQAWFDERLWAIRGANLGQAEVELRCLIREVHVALRFRELKAQVRRRLDARKHTGAACAG